MGEPRSGLSNIHERSGLNKPDRATVLARLTVLHETLSKAIGEKDEGKVMLTRHDIDEQLDELSKTMDPAGIASVQEFGPLG